MAKRKPSFFHPYPKYLQIMDMLRNRMLTEMEPGERIPSEIDLCKQFGVCRETIRQALDPLEAEGLITRTRGRGSFVARRRPVRSPKKKFTGLLEDFVQPPVFKLIQKDVISGDDEATRSLRLDRGAFLMRVLRVSILEGNPFAYHVAFLPAQIGLRVIEEDLEYASIASLLATRCGFQLEEDHQTLEADAADVQLAEHLKVPMGFPLLVMRRIYISTGETPIAYFKSYYRSDRYMYTVKLRQYEGHSQVIPLSSKEESKPASQALSLPREELRKRVAR